MANQSKRVKIISPVVEESISTATRMASSYNHSYINTCHLFLGALKFINKFSNTKTFLIRTKNKRSTVVIYNADKVKDEDLEHLTIRDDEYWLYDTRTYIPSSEEIIDKKEISKGENNKDYHLFADDFLKLLDKYRITSHNFKYAFAIRNPKEKDGNNVQFNEETGKEEQVLTDQPDCLDVYKMMRTIFQETKRPQDLPDFIKLLFGSDDYELKRVIDDLQDISNSDRDDYGFLKPFRFISSDLYSDIKELCNKYIPEFNGTAIKVLSYKQLDDIKFLRNINKYVADNPRNSYGLDNIIDNIEVQLCTEGSKSVALVGPSGCGKNEVVYTLAERINKGEVPDFLKNTAIYELNVTSLVSGAHYRGDFEQRAQGTINAVSQFKNVILFIDKGEMISSAGSSGSGEGDSSLGNIIEPYLSKNELTVITSMASSDYKILEKNKTLCDRFIRFNVNEPTDDETKEILKNLLAHKEEFYGVKAEDKLLDSIITLGPKYEPGKANPRRSITLLDSAFAYSKKNGKSSVGEKEVKEYLAKRYNFTLTDTKADDTYKELKSKILGQDKAIDRIYENLQICEMGIVDEKSPLYVMGFFGPTGTGKSETAKIIAKYYFGSEKRCIIINTSTLSDKNSGSNLIGSARGYVGYGEDTPLTKVKENPNCVILFDEIEKASDEVRELLLGGLNDGYIEDSRGDIIPLRNAIIIFTSNVGFDFNSFKSVGAGLVKETAGTANVRESLQKIFKPEFLGRINDIITFDYLSDAIIKQLVYKITEDYKRTSGLDINIEYTEDDFKEIKRLAKIKETGARLLSQVVRRMIAKKIIASKNLVKEGM